MKKDCIVSQKAIPVKSRVKVAPAEPVAESPAVVDEIVCMKPAEPVEEIKPKPAKKPRKSKKTQE